MLHKNLTSDHAPSKNLKSDHAPPKKNRNNHVPTKFEKRPCSTKIWEVTMLHRKIDMTVFPQNVTNGLKFWWNMVISQVSMVTSEIFRWSMVASQIFVEHGCFSNCGGTWSLLIFLVEHGRFSNFGGTWSFFEKTLNCGQAGPKIKCSTKIWGHLSHFGGARSFSFFDGAWSLLKFWWNMVIFQILVEQGYFLRKLLIADKWV